MQVLNCEYNEHMETETVVVGRCTLPELFQLLSRKWVLPVLYSLQHSPRPLRFGEVLESVGRVTTSELTKTLRYLESLGLIDREQFNEIPPRVEYCCTELGLSLKQPLCDLAAWLQEHPELLQH